MGAGSNDSKIHLMAFEPRAGVTTTVYTVGLPPALQEALFELMPPKREGDSLYTRQLKSDLQCWLNQAVELEAVRRGVREDNWLVALEPPDLESLCRIIAIWLAASCSEEKKGLPAYKRAMDLLASETFEACSGVRSLALFDERGRPNGQFGGLAFCAFAAQVAGALHGRELRLGNGESVRFYRVARGTRSAFELMSDIRWYKDEPWAFVLKFHVETLPVGRKARLNLDVGVRRFISNVWQDDPYMPNGVNAFVRDANGTFRVVEYGYRKRERRVDWNESSKQNYEFATAQSLPDIGDYLGRIAFFAHGDGCPQILSPYSTSSGWASEPHVASGASVIDKALFFDAAAEALSGLVTPVAPLSSVQRAGLKLAHEDSDGDVEAHAEWTASNRRRLAACTGEDSVRFELIGTAADKPMLWEVKEEIIRFLGDEGISEGLELKIDICCHDELLQPLEEGSLAYKKLRIRRIGSSLGKAAGLTACIVVLPGPDAFSKLGKGGSSRDPKQAIRAGLALSGRLSQFLVPEQENVEHRIGTAVRDLMRQMGFVPELAPGRGKLSLETPVVGLYVYTSPNGAKKTRLPLAVRMEPASGLVVALCPLFEVPSLPYWRAELELARLSCAPTFADDAKVRAGGSSLASMVDGLIADAMAAETLLLVQAYGPIRWPGWWPGISDAGLADGALTYGPRGSERPLDLRGSRLQVLRVRSGADGEVPDYFTDAAEPKPGEDAKRKTKQGLFVSDGCVLGLAPRPNDAPYTWSTVGSKFSKPTTRFCEKTLNEYCLLTSDDMELALRCARYAEALRAKMVQLYKSDMHVNLPAPLHLAHGLEEYIWKEG